jgi:hypothetical protein
MFLILNSQAKTDRPSGVNAREVTLLQRNPLDLRRVAKAKECSPQDLSLPDVGVSQLQQLKR